MMIPLRQLTLASLALSVYATFATCAFAQTEFSDPQWQFVFRKPADGWEKPDFQPNAWRKGFGGFGERSTPGSRVGTDWQTNNIWMRREIDLQAVPAKPAIFIHHDEDAEVYVNGQQVLKVTGYITEYKVMPLDEKGKQALKVGKNLVAVHCRQTGGGQFIDVHVIDADNVPKLPAPQRSTTPFKTELTTEWGEKVTPENAWQEYPRPQLVREQWTNLNGHWDYAITSETVQDKPAKWNGKILVPYCLESKLGGVQRLLGTDEALWYHRTFTAQPKSGKSTLLNFEAVDYRCQVWVNDQLVGGHQGGNVPFSLDITKAIKSGENHVVVRVEDETEGFQLNGKQTLSPRGIWYTQVSGIWQTVWLEEVPARQISDLKIETNAEEGSITVRAELGGTPVNGEKLKLTVNDDREFVASAEGTAVIKIPVPNAKLWSPDSPHLYGLHVSLNDGNGKEIDSVTSYAGIRSVGKTRDDSGNLRMTLNGKKIFHFGPLDQGWWPDGLLTPPSDAAMLSDIEFLKAAGFNMIRKHIKVEPRRYYWHCDKLGMLVWQDQVSGGANPPWTRLEPNPKDADWTDAHHQQFMAEFEEMIDELESHPSIVVWTPFNEAWGQHRTVEVGKWTVARDPSRIVNIASGGNFWEVGDIVDEHRYPHPGFPFVPERDKSFVKVVGEFGGHGLPVDGHIWDSDRNNWGYGGLPKNAEEYKERYLESIRLLVELQEQGIAAGVYTQTTDVEGEINGLLTYDRRVKKLSAEELSKIHAPLYQNKQAHE